MKQRNWFPLSAITHKKTQFFFVFFFFREKLLAEDLLSLQRVYKATQSSPGVLNVTDFFKSCVTTEKGTRLRKNTVPSSKENIELDAWYEIREKFTMLRFPKTQDFFHFYVIYCEA